MKLPFIDCEHFDSNIATAEFICRITHETLLAKAWLHRDSLECERKSFDSKRFRMQIKCEYYILNFRFPADVINIGCYYETVPGPNDWFVFVFRAKNNHNYKRKHTYSASGERIDATFAQQQFDYIFSRMHCGNVKDVEIILWKMIKISLFMAR